MQQNIALRRMEQFLLIVIKLYLCENACASLYKDLASN